MKFLRHIRSKSRLEDRNHHSHQNGHLPAFSKSAHSSNRPNPTARYPQALLEYLLGCVCVHATDEEYTCSEDSMSDGGCMLCDMRDLAHCALVDQQWSKASQKVLYHSIRIDAVHYCDREAELAAKRAKRSSDRHGNPSQARLQLLSRTVRENGSLAQKVQYLKIPYMTREGSVADLARTISFLPNLLYVDLPDSIYVDDASSSTLKLELQLRCPRLSQMKYLHGSESSFQSLAVSRYWQNLQTLELSKLDVDMISVVDVLNTLPTLREVKLLHMPLLTDSLFDHDSRTLSFPALAKIHLEGTPNISVQGLVTYLSRPDAKECLNHLTLIDTGIPAADGYLILLAAPNLVSLRFAANVSRPFSSSQPPPLASPSLKLLRYELTNDSISPVTFASVCESYYSYLSNSILIGSLPLLSHLYVLSDTPQKLLQPSSNPQFSKICKGEGAKPAPLSLGISQPLHLYTKAIREMEWNLTFISPPTPAHHLGSTIATRPESVCHAATLSPQYSNAGRDSVVVGNGFGGFLTVPSPSFSPSNSQHRSRRQDIDAWMG